MMPTTNLQTEFYLNPVLEKNDTFKFETLTVDFSNKNRVTEKLCTRNVQIMYLGKIKDLFYFDVFTSKVTFTSNQSIANERLLKEDMYAFGDILLGVNDKGEIQKIKNLKKMQQQWEGTKSELRKDHVGFEFEDFLTDITEVLEDEEKTVYFLNTKAMFGLYFHGLFGENDVRKTPIKRKSILLDFDDTEITEEIRMDSRELKIIISAQKSDDEHKNIISDNDIIKKHEGELSYRKDNQLQEGFIEIENENMNIKYSVLWVC
jgi:hypothetical protein